MLRLLKRVTGDVLAGRNIETYVVTFVALGVALLSVIEDVVPLDLQMAAILAALALLVFKSTAPDSGRLDLDDVLRDRQSYGAFKDFIKGGEELQIYAPSAVNVLSNTPDIEREILRAGSLRVLIQDPTIPSSIEALHNQLDQQMSAMLVDDIQRSVTILENLKARGLDVDYRFMPYSPGFSLTIVDPDGRDGRAIVEMIGFNRESINDRMHVEIRREQSNYWFEYWTQQFTQMWEMAREP